MNDKAHSENMESALRPIADMRADIDFVVKGHKDITTDGLAFQELGRRKHAWIFESLARVRV
jgi:hypothetical protein